jgi:hypothetical protein
VSASELVQVLAAAAAAFTTGGPLPPARCDLELTGVGGASRVLAIMRS